MEIKNFEYSPSALYIDGFSHDIICFSLFYRVTVQFVSIFKDLQVFLQVLNFVDRRCCHYKQDDSNFSVTPGFVLLFTSGINHFRGVALYFAGGRRFIKSSLFSSSPHRRSLCKLNFRLVVHLAYVYQTMITL